MKVQKRNRAVLVLVALNLLLAAALMAGPAVAQVLPFAGLKDCCVDKTCCFDCCWIVEDCEDDGDCRIN